MIVHYQGDVFGDNVRFTKIVGDSKLNRLAARHLQTVLFLTGILPKQGQSKYNIRMIVAIEIILAETLFNIVNIHIVRITVAFDCKLTNFATFFAPSSAPFPLEKNNSLNLLSMRF